MPECCSLSVDFSSHLSPVPLVPDLPQDPRGLTHLLSLLPGPPPCAHPLSGMGAETAEVLSNPYSLQGSGKPLSLDLIAESVRWAGSEGVAVGLV